MCAKWKKTKTKFYIAARPHIRNFLETVVKYAGCGMRIAGQTVVR